MNRITDYNKLATDITDWIRNYAITNNIKSLVVGVSGGIDSAVVSTLCAMTGLPTFCAVIDIHSDKEHKQRAIGQCAWLEDEFSNCSYKSINMNSTMETIMIPTPTDAIAEHIAANTKSRLRMLTLYNWACAGQGIVVGTGNKVEDFGVFYFSKWGDGGVDISPIADLYKTEVRELGRHLGIAQEILDAVPTDGLWADNRTDESVLQCTYEELEWAMEECDTYNDHHNDVHYTPDQIRILERYRELHTKGQHKVLPIPIYKLNS